MHPRLSMNVTTTWQWDVGRCIEAYAKRGIPGIGLVARGVQEFGSEKAIRLVKDAGLHVASYTGAGPFIDGNGAPVRGVVERASRALDEAAELGADCVYAVTGPRGGLTWEEAAKRVKDGLHEVLPLARERNVKLAIEPVHPIRQDLTFVSEASDAAGMAEEVGDPLLGYVFDFYHLWWQRGVIETIRQSAGRIFAVQVSDQKPVTLKTMDRAMPGEGIIPLAELVRALEESGYEGFYDAEVISEDNAAMGYDTALDKVIDGFDKLWAEAHA